MGANRVFKSLKLWWEHRQSGSISDPWTVLLLGGHGPTAAGVEVSAETAMRCTPVFASVKVLAESLQLLPLHLYRRQPDGGKERATDHPLYALLSVAANEWTPASEFRMIMTTDLALHGRAYAFVGRDSAGRPVELIRLHPAAVTVERNRLTQEPVYRVNADGETREYSRRDIVHLRAIGTGLDGDSPVVQGREAIAFAMVLERHGAGLFGRGTRASGILKTGARNMSEAVLERLRKSWEAMFQGGANAGKTVILEEGMDFQQLTLTSTDAQFLENRKFQVQEVARLWRVPLHMLGDMERVTHSNAEEMGRQFLEFCVLPLLRTWEDAVTITLLTPAEREEYFAEFLLDELARAALAQRFAAYSQAINAGILSPNECRAMENRGPYVGGETYMRPVNTAPAPTTSTKDGNNGDA